MSEPDRFDEFALGVKQKFRPDWLDSENKLFVNKLNYVCTNFDETQKTAKNLKKTVYTEHQTRIDDLEMRIRDLKEEHTNTRVKLDSIETNLPRMIREMIDFYADSKLNPKFEELVTYREFKEAVSVKMDFAFFNEYIKQQQQNEIVNDKEFKTEERLFAIEQKVSSMVLKDEFKN